jgi:hypothetical protein
MVLGHAMEGQRGAKLKIDSSHRSKGPMADLREVVEYFTENGFRLQGSRVRFYQEIHERFANSPELDDDEAWALAELRELRIIVHAARRNNVIASGLKRCLKGAALLRDETTKNSGNAGRNYTFELFTASKMVILGANTTVPAFGKGADVEFLHEGKTVPVECKRLYSPENAVNLMKECCEQVSKRVEEGEFGVAAISLTRVLWVEKSSLIASSEAEAQLDTERLYARLVEEMVKLLQRFPKVALIYTHFQLPCVGEDEVFTIYERKFFRTRVGYENLPEAHVVDEFERLMTEVGIESAIGAPIPGRSA